MDDAEKTVVDAIREDARTLTMGARGQTFDNLVNDAVRVASNIEKLCVIIEQMETGLAVDRGEACPCCGARTVSTKQEDWPFQYEGETLKTTVPFATCSTCTESWVSPRGADARAVNQAIIDHLKVRLISAQAESAARYDCHGGPGTTEPACDACVTCLTRRLEAYDMAKVGPELKWTTNGEAGDGQYTCSNCGTDMDEPHTWRECVAVMRDQQNQGDEHASLYFQDEYRRLKTQVDALSDCHLILGEEHPRCGSCAQCLAKRAQTMETQRDEALAALVSDKKLEFLEHQGFKRGKKAALDIVWGQACDMGNRQTCEKCAERVRSLKPEGSTP